MFYQITSPIINNEEGMGESNWIDSFKVNIKPNVQVDYGYVVKLNKMVEI